ncbi:hypothetical protein HYZ78_04085 [Candidatus Microgenomates bacterium]|nr:hypothetical protein [Candidatus Microgenomates bacterium]
MSNVLQFIVLTLGIYFSLFLFWRLLHEDYEDSDIFSLWFVSLSGGILGYFVFNFFFPQNALSVSLGIALLFTMLRARRIRMKLFEILESAIPSIFIFLVFVLISQMIWEISIPILVDLLLVALALGLFMFLKARYRRFLWYPSGKIGFASLATVLVYFVIRAAVALTLGTMLSFKLVLFSLPETLVLGLTIGMTSLVLLYVRSGRRDLARFFNNK